MRRIGRARWGWVVLAIVLALVAGAVVALPRIVRARAIAAARERGIDLAIGGVSLWPGTATFSDVSVVFRDLPLKAEVREVDVKLDGLTPVAVGVTGAVATVDGTLAEVGAALGKADETRRSGAAAAAKSGDGRSAIRTASVKDAKVSWTGPFGPGSSVEADAVAGDLAFDEIEALETLRFIAPKVMLKAASKPLGPFRAQAESARGVTSITLSDPDPARRAFVRYQTAKERVVDVEVAKDRLSKLGVAGLAPGQDPEVSVKIHAVDDRVESGVFSYGPFKGTIGGTISVDGPSMHLTYASAPVPCSEIAEETAAGAMGGIGAQIGQLAQATGLTHAIAGEAKATGEIDWDARDPAKTRATFVPSQDCALRFGGFK